MPDTFIKIASVTVGSGGASTIEFTGIPSTYTDLCIMLSGRTTANGDNYGQIDLSFNGAPSGTSYSWRRLMGNGSTASSASGSSDNAVDLWQVNGSGSTSSTFSNSSYYIPNYAGSTNKSVSADGVTENNATQALATLYAGLWADTSAITSVRFTVTYGTAFAQHSTAVLYGIKNS